MISATVLYRNAVLTYNNHALLKLISVLIILFYFIFICLLGCQSLFRYLNVFITWVTRVKYNLII